MARSIGIVASSATGIGLGLGIVSLAVGAPGCTGKDPYNPGTPLGTFHVTGKLTQTSCGPVPDPWEFDVRLAHDGTTLYWIQGTAPIQGRVDAASRAALSAEEVHVLRPEDAKRRTPSCAVKRTDALEVVLAGEDQKPAAAIAHTKSFSGTLVYRFAPTTESDCGDQLLSTGGDFEALPCEVRYAVDGRVVPKEAAR